MMILESMQDGLLYSNLLLKMYLMSLKSGGMAHSRLLRFARFAAQAGQ